LLATLQPGDVVVTARLDRAFRATAVALDALEQLKKIKIALHVVDLGGDITDAPPTAQISVSGNEN
jgi:putative DNA-invertase from lambdoid prophage Rac